MALNAIIYKLHNSDPNSIEEEDILTGYELRVNDRLNNFNIGHSVRLIFDDVETKYIIVDIEHIVDIKRENYKLKDPTSLDGRVSNYTLVFLKEKETTEDNMDSILG